MFPVDWQKLEELSDLLSDFNDLEACLSAGLNFITRALNHPGGMLLVQSTTDPTPILTVQQNLPPAQAAQLAEANSPLRQLIKQVLETHCPTRSELSQHLAAVPICTWDDKLTSAQPPAADNCQGILIINGPSLSEAEFHNLLWLTRPLHRAIRLNRSHLHKQEQLTNRQNTELAALHLASAVIGSSLEFDEMEAWMIKGVCRILNAEAGSLMEIDEERDDLLIKKTLGENQEWVYEASLQWGSGIEEQCISSRVPVRINDLSSEPGSHTISAAVPNYKINSILCAPLAVNEQVMGAIAVINKRSGPFTLHDQELLVAMAASIANAIYNTRLIQQLKVANADLEASRWQLLRSRNTLRALFDSIPASIYIIDQKYNLVALNMTRSSMAKSKPNALVGRQCFEALYNREDICPGCRVMETLVGGQNTSRNKRQWKRDSHGSYDEPMEWEISTYPIRDDSGDIEQAIILEQDFTEKRRLEATLAQSEKLAAVGQLAAGVAHEINNPLTAIIANAQMLQRELPPGDERQELVELIAKAGNRATQVVRNLFDFARKEHYEFAPTDLNETIREALALIQHEVVLRAIHLEFNPAEALPLVMASADHLQGVWLNLVMNAIDALENSQGGVQITTRQVGSEVMISIMDNGKGIPPERLNRIFEPFFTTKSPGRGTGLGLSVCHRIIKQHGGHILVNSQVGQGTEFTVILPIE